MGKEKPSQQGRYLPPSSSIKVSPEERGPLQQRSFQRVTRPDPTQGNLRFENAFPEALPSGRILTNTCVKGAGGWRPSERTPSEGRWYGAEVRHGKHPRSEQGQHLEVGTSWHGEQRQPTNLLQRVRDHFSNYGRTDTQQSLGQVILPPGPLLR